MTGHLEHKLLLVVKPLPVLPDLEPILKQSGWRLEVSPGLVDAFARVARRHFAAVLLHEDALPKGAPPLEELKRLCPDLSVVVAVNSPKQIAAADDVVFLPCDLHYIASVLDRACERQSSKRQLAEMQERNEHLRNMLTDERAQLATLERAWTRLIQTVSNLEALLKTVLDLFAEVAGAERLSLMLVERDGRDELRIVKAQGVPDKVVAQTRLGLGQGVAGWVAKHGRPILGTTETTRSRGESSARAYRSDSFLSLPLKAGDEVLGVVNMTERAHAQPFSETEAKRLGFLAAQAAIWISYSQKLQQAQKLSLMDELTCLHNRRYFTGAFERELARAKRTGKQSSLAMLDIDRFKTFNDTYGHQAGDEILKQLALVLQENVRTTDVVCRYGGEEFAVILPPTGKFADRPGQDAILLVDRLRRAVSELTLAELKAEPGGLLTISAGVATFPRDGREVDELIAVADEMLYKAKEIGGNCVCSRYQSQ